MTFTHHDLADLDRLLQRASAVVSMREIAAGNDKPTTIGLRHDIDDNRDSFPTAVELARWEAQHGYRSTYYVLHTASYWMDGPYFQEGLETIALAGHEIGLHVNGIAEALKTGDDPHDIVWAALEQLRGFGHVVTGAASHGDEICRTVGFVNYEQFTDCAKGNPNRTLTYRGRELTLAPMPLSAFGLTYEAYHLPRAAYLSDTGGTWNQPLNHDFQGQLHVLMHSDWWSGAFAEEPVAA